MYHYHIKKSIIKHLLLLICVNNNNNNNFFSPSSSLSFDKKNYYFLLIVEAIQSKNLNFFFALCFLLILTIKDPLPVFSFVWMYVWFWSRIKKIWSLIFNVLSLFVKKNHNRYRHLKFFSIEMMMMKIIIMKCK